MQAASARKDRTALTGTAWGTAPPFTSTINNLYTIETDEAHRGYWHRAAAALFRKLKDDPARYVLKFMKTLRQDTIFAKKEPFGLDSREKTVVQVAESLRGDLRTIVAYPRSSYPSIVVSTLMIVLFDEVRLHLTKQKLS